MADTPDALAALNRIFVRTLRRMADSGDADEIDAACRLAAEAYALLRHDWPDDAQRINAAMHYLTHPKRIGNKGETDERRQP